MARGRTSARDVSGADRSVPSPRHGHLEARVRRALQMILARGLNDPRVRGLVSVTELELAPDLGRATVRVSVLPERYGRRSVAGLRAAASRLAAEIGRMVRARRIPMLDFQLDERLKKQAAIDALLISDREEHP